MVKDKDKLFIECECVDRCTILTIEFLDDFDIFNLNLYRIYAFNNKKEIYEFNLSQDQAKHLIEYLQKKLKTIKKPKKRISVETLQKKLKTTKERNERIFFECETADRNIVMTIEFLEWIDFFCLDFLRKKAFNREKEIYGLTFEEDQAKQIIEYLQKKQEEVSS